MSLESWLTLAILLVTFSLLLFTKLPAVAVFLGALTASLTLKLAPIDASVAGFSNTGVLTIGALFMVAAGMYSTGAISLISDKLIGRPKNEREAQARILPPVAIGSAFLNNTPLVAMMIPVIRDLCRTTGLAASKLFIPLSYASFLGGSTTLIGTSVNLIIAGLILDELARGAPGAPPMQAIQMFDPAWVAAPAAVLGVGFVMVFGRWLLPEREKEGRGEVAGRRYAAEFVIPADSPLLGRTLDEAGFARPVGYDLLGLRRGDGSERRISDDTVLESGDVLAFSVDIGMLPTLWTMQGLEPLHTLQPMTTKRYTHCLTEVVISPQCTVVGHRVSELPMPDSPYTTTLVAVSRRRRPVEGPIDDVTIQVGDNAVLEVNEDFFYIARNEEEFSLVKRLEGFRIRRWHRAAEATVIVAAMVTVVTLGWMNMLNAAMLATGAMLLTGCMTLRAAARSIDWATLIVLASAIGLAAAVTHSGLADQVAETLYQLGANNPYTALTAVFVGRVVMANLITNAASAVFMFPIALSIAGHLGVSFMPFAIALMTGTAGASITPAAYQTNLMVYGPGGYVFGDFVKMGIPLTILVGAVTIFLAPLVFGF